MAVDASGNLYVSDASTSWIHQIRPDGTAIGFYESSSPRGLLFDSATGQLFIASSLAYELVTQIEAGLPPPVQCTCIRMVTPDGTISALPVHLPDGSTPANIIEPESMAFGSDGALYITEWSNARVSRIAPDGTLTTVVGGNGQGSGGDGGPAAKAQLAGPTGIAFDAMGQLYIADSLANRIRRVALDGTISTFAGTGQQGFSGDGGPASAAEFAWPAEILFDAAGNLLVADYLNGRVRRVDANGAVTTIAGNGATPPAAPAGWGPLPPPTTLAQEPPPSPAKGAFLQYPTGMVVDSNGAVYFMEASARRIRKITPDGLISTVAILPRAAVGGLAIDGQGRLYVAETFLANPAGGFGSGQIQQLGLVGSVVGRVDPDGTYTVIAGQPGQPGYGGDGQPAVSALLDAPTAVAVDASGNVYIADWGNERIRRVGPDGVITTVTGPTQFGRYFASDILGQYASDYYYPSSLAIDPSGRLYVALVALGSPGAHPQPDTGGSPPAVAQIFVVNPDGSLTLVAGTEAVDTFYVDGLPALDSTLMVVSGIAFRPTGEMLVFDFWDGYLREVGQDGTMRLLSGYWTDTPQEPHPGNYCLLGDGGPPTDACFGNDLYHSGAAGLPGWDLSAGPALHPVSPPWGLPLPGSIALDSAGNVYVSQPLDTAGGEIRVVKALSAQTPAVQIVKP
jgi:sugar lactone lactonase YvrE